MDNASKALVMAGAILIAVMLISLGVFMFRGGEDTTRKTMDQVDQVALEAHNHTYNSFVGKNRSYSDAKALIAKVRNHNSNSKSLNTWGVIKISKQSSANFEPKTTPAAFSTTGASYGFSENSLNETKYYTIGIVNTNSLGAICEIGIFEQNGFIEN